MNNFKNQKGITFVEIIIAIVIFGLALPVMFHGLFLAYGEAKKSGQRTGAIAKCQERIEAMKNTAYANITSANFPNDQVTLDNHGTASPNDDLIASRTVTLVDNANPAFKTVTVTASWTNGKYSEQIKTVISP